MNNDVFIGIDGAETDRLCGGRCRDAAGSRALRADRNSSAGRLADGASVMALSATKKSRGIPRLAKYSAMTDFYGPRLANENPFAEQRHMRPSRAVQLSTPSRQAVASRYRARGSSFLLRP